MKTVPDEVTRIPETAKPLEKLAINPDDPDALKVVKKDRY